MYIYMGYPFLPIQVCLSVLSVYLHVSHLPIHPSDIFISHVTSHVLLYGSYVTSYIL